VKLSGHVQIMNLYSYRQRSGTISGDGDIAKWRPGQELNEHAYDNKNHSRRTHKFIYVKLQTHWLRRLKITETEIRRL
jgi:hypothetical protein